MKKTSLLSFVIIVLVLLISSAYEVDAGSGQIVYSAVDGVPTWSQKRILIGASGWNAYASSTANQTIDKIGHTIATAYWICPNGSIGYTVSQYDLYKFNSSQYDLNYAYLPNSLNYCGGTRHFAGGNHFYELNQVQDFVTATHTE